MRFCRCAPRIRRDARVFLLFAGELRVMYAGGGVRGAINTSQARVLQRADRRTGFAAMSKNE